MFTVNSIHMKRIFNNDQPTRGKLNKRNLIQIFNAITICCILVVQCSFIASAQTNDYDIVVIGATPAGIAAAISAGRQGKSVLLVEQSPVLGGMLSSGVSRMDDQLAEANSGIIDEFRKRIVQYHRTELANDPVVKKHLEQPTMAWNLIQGRTWEPHTAARVYEEMVSEIPTITIRFNEVPVGATVKGGRVVAVTTRDRNNQGQLGSRHQYEGRVFIDATYEADVAAFADVPFRIGREARSREEPHAGVIYTDAFCSEEGTLKGTIFPGSSGKADNRSQAFTFRFVAKDYGSPDHPYRLKTPPSDYDASRYKWDPNNKPIMPNGKYDMLGINWGGDLAGYGTRYVLANWEERAKIEEIFRNHSLGWLYYIQTEGGSPHIGLADDEFTDNNNFPYRLYVRQGRRIEGLYTLTESDIHKDLRGNGFRGPLNKESVAIGMYPIDAHNVQDPTDRSTPCYGEGAAEGTLHLQDVTGPYQIPYGVMVPKNRKGLLVPVGISSTHVAMSSVRMEPVWSSLGQAAGVAAALALDSGLELSQVPINKIQDILLEEHSLLFFYKDLPGDAPEFEAVQKLSLLGAVDGDENYYFRPDQPITIGEFARLVVEGLNIPLSITAAHFHDVPRGHPAFKYIETLYDYSTQSREPFFTYEVRNYLNYWWLSQSRNGPPVYAYPDHAVTSEVAAQITSGLLRRDITVSADPATHLTRGEAAQLIYRLRNDMDRETTGSEN